MPSEALTRIEDPSTDAGALRSWVGSLPAGEDTPALWRGIADDVRYTPHHRRLAVAELFRRHVVAPLEVGELVRLLGSASWLADHAVRRVDKLGGKIPVRFVLEDSIFAVGVLPAEGGGSLTIYLRVQGQWRAEDLRAALRGRAAPDGLLASHILEWGLFEQAA